MNIYKRELKAHRKSLLVWSVSMFLLIAAGMGKYSAGIGAGAGSINEMVGQLPKSLQNLFGIGVFDLSKALDYFAVLFLYLILLAGVHAVMLGAGILAKEERDKTAEFLLVKPVSRGRILAAKLSAALTIAAVFNIVSFLSSAVMLSYYSKGTPFLTGLLKLNAGMLALQILFVAAGAFFAAAIGSPKRSSAAATGVMLAMFMVYVVYHLVGKTSVARFFTLFQYFDAKDLLLGPYSAAYPVIAAVLLGLLVAGAFRFYNKRDMKI